MDSVIDELAEPEPRKLDHYYAEKVDDIYFYLQEKSENSDRDGVQARDLLGVKYLGRGSNGDVQLVTVNNMGEPQAYVHCSDPCKVVRFGAERAVEFDRQSVIGAAISDALNDKLEQTTLYESMRKSIK